MPANERSLTLTDTYRDRLEQLSDRIGAYTAQRWQQTVTLDDLDASHALWLATTVAALTQAQRFGVRLTAGYLAAFLASELGGTPQPLAADDSPVGLAEDGQPVDVPLSKTLIGVLAALKDGKPPEVALAEQSHRAVRLAASATIAAPRLALAGQIASHPEIVGWRRVTHGGCGACLASAAHGYAKHERMPVHPHCHCTQEPVIADAPDRVKRPTGPEIFAAMSREKQDQTLGPDAAQAVREGRVAWPDLIAVSPMVVGPDLITQATV
jgi:hypothetical protein